MSALYTSEQVRRIDQQAISAGTSGYELMQRAAAAVLRSIAALWPQCRQLLIVCGAGNNAGDGYELARQAQAAGWRVQVFYLKSPAEMQGEALTAANAAIDAQIDCRPFARSVLLHELGAAADSQPVIVDAMLGIGFCGELNDAYAEAVSAINSTDAPVFAIDVPTGVNADTGHVTSQAVKADATLCVVGRKQGLYTGAAPAYTGVVLFDGLDIAPSVLQPEPANSPAARGIDGNLLRQVQLARSRTAHKGDSGHVLVIGGDAGYGGAALMTAEAAARTGAGTVSLITRPEHVTAMLVRRPEVMVHAVAHFSAEAAQNALALMARASAIVLGPGLGRSAWSEALLDAVLARSAELHIPLVLDADALNLLSARAVDWRQLAADEVRAQWIITPHPGEAARLLGCSTAQVSADRFAAVRALQQKTGAVCLLKGAGTLLAFPNREAPLDICLEGNPGMASGGMGDVLAGISGALLALGYVRQQQHSEHAFNASQAARLAVCVHALAAAHAAEYLGERGLLATDLLPRLPVILSGGVDGRIGL